MKRKTIRTTIYALARLCNSPLNKTLINEGILDPPQRNPPYDCPHYYSDWNADECCKYLNSGCEYDEFTGCPIYDDIFGIKKEMVE